MAEKRRGLTYAQAGVDIDAGNRMVDLIKPFVRATARPGADKHIWIVGLGNIGSFLAQLVARISSVARLTLVDFDSYSAANLVSQSIRQRDVGAAEDVAPHGIPTVRDGHRCSPSAITGWNQYR